MQYVKVSFIYNTTVFVIVVHVFSSCSNRYVYLKAQNHILIQAFDSQYL